MKLSQRWKQTSLPNKLLIGTGAIVAFSTLLQVGVATFHYWLMKESGQQAAQQTDKLVAASEKLAQATANALEETKRSNTETANRADIANQISKEFANAAQRQANASMQSAESGKTLARATEKSADIASQSFALTQRPTVYFAKTQILPFEEGREVTIQLQIKNAGLTNAYRITIDTVFSFRSIPFAEPLKYPAKSGYGFIRQPLLEPQSEGWDTRAYGGFPMTAQRIQAVTIAKTHALFFFGSGEYFDGLGRKYTLDEFCYVYDPAEKRLIFCSPEVKIER
jgi:hypothetical protein